jgi:serine/threonine protein kinase
MTYTWEQLEGVSLANEYGLDQWLGSDQSGAFYLTSYGPQRQRAVLKLMADDPPSAGEQLRLWEQTAWLTHPSLMGLLDSGRAEWSGESYLYAVFEAPDDSLTAAVQNGPLGEAETRDVLTAVLAALRYLHHLGWAHTSIDTEHVVAVGDHIKLASDTLQPRASASTQSDDIWALGALLFELVSGHRIAYGETADVSGISEPLRSIIAHATDPDEHLRWTAAQIAEASTGAVEIPAIEREDLRSHEASHEAAPASNGWHVPDAPHPEIFATLPHDEAPQLEPEPIAPYSSHPSGESASLEVEDYHPSPDQAAPVPLPRLATKVHEPYTSFENENAFHTPPEHGPSFPFAKYVPMVAVAAIALLVIIFVAAHHAAPAPPAVAIVPPPPVVEAPARVIPVPQARVVPVNVPKSSSPQNWRVISFTYARMKDAEKKAASINAKYRDIHAEVFTLNSKPQTYLISIGAHLTRDEAASLQRKAIGKGMPHDTFIRNFSN